MDRDWQAKVLGHPLQGGNASAAEVIVLDPLYSAHDQDKNDTHALAAQCHSLLWLCEVPAQC